ncbi:acyltransferase [Tsukamurella sp. 8F]|uniref:acyltransferase family protein n=1 Tax=unclassified Tsukamurella TaxID=2633480 RepID=UPI0023B9ED83|nr:MULTISPECIES: acyltransferase [unclassified Tsukamurella]MDF0530454.1 acyltransferase [Tsukamurella sp. 8J]MDF0587725.1 acyltransferase [Tsukamurella sp. 8F]
MQQRVASLTGLRALAAAAVCATHAAFWTGNYTPDTAGNAFARLEVGVPVFFALSGFLLFRPWVRVLTDGAGRQPSLRHYAWHRFRRVLPAYWIVVIAVYLVYLVRDDPNPSGHGIGGLVRNLTLTQIYGLGHLRNGLTQTWSMCVEVAFYLVLPVTAWVLTAVVCRYRYRLGRLLTALAVLAAVTPVWIVLTPDPAFLDFTARLWPPEFGWWFVAGMALAAVAPRIRRWPAWATPACLAVAAAAFAVACLPLAGPPTIVPNDTGQAITKSMLYLVFSVTVIAPLAFGSSGWFTRALGTRPVVWLGDISYEFFLVHLIVLDILLADVFGWRVFTGHFVIAFLGTAVVSIPLAWLLRFVTRFGDNGGRTPRRKEANHGGTGGRGRSAARGRSGIGRAGSRGGSVGSSAHRRTGAPMV